MEREQIAKEALKAMYGSEIEHPLQIQKEWSLKLADYVLDEREKAYLQGYDDACDDNPQRGQNYIKIKREQAYDQGYAQGYEQACKDHNILYGDNAKNFIDKADKRASEV